MAREVADKIVVDGEHVPSSGLQPSSLFRGSDGPPCLLNCNFPMSWPHALQRLRRSVPRVSLASAPPRHRDHTTVCRFSERQEACSGGAPWWHVCPWGPIRDPSGPTGLRSCPANSSSHRLVDFQLMADRLTLGISVGQTLVGPLGKPASEAHAWSLYLSPGFAQKQKHGTRTSMVISDVPSQSAHAACVSRNRDCRNMS